MMKRETLSSFLFVVLISLPGMAQEKSKIKFGDVNPEDFSTKVYSIDSNANAVVIADIGTSSIEGNTKGWFSLIYKRYRRVHILNKNGYGIANITISLYADNEDEEVLDRLKAVTYNLENGKVIETKLDTKSGVFKDRINKNLVAKKFTFPNIKEGSIIEFEYTIKSDYLRNLQPWEFQGSNPVLWSEYNLSLPEFLGYVFLTQGYKAYDIKNQKERFETFQVADSRGAGATERVNFQANVTDYKWVIKNAPALKEESYTSTIDNHITKIEFQLSEYRRPLTYTNVMGSWTKLSDDLMKAEYFGQQVNRDNPWLNEITDPLVKGVTDKVEKARSIFAYVRDNFTCTNYSRMTMDQNLRTIAKSRNGNVAEINLLLTAMLKHEGIDAAPVILSTRSHGYTYSIYPILSKFNYVISKATIDGTDYYLDASEPRLGFGHLPPRCYNGHARVINAGADPIDINPDLVTEKKITSIFIINDEKGKWVGSMQQVPGYYESWIMRNQLKEKGQEALMKDIKKEFGSDIQISNPVIDSVDKLDNEIGIKYDFDLPEETGDIIYLNPMFGEAYKENPFKSAERVYPVEMPFVINQTYILQLEVPKGYDVDEIPKSAIIKFNDEEDAVFEYRVSQSENNIALRCRLRFKKTYFQPDEYETLREFFSLIVNKESEQIVFKKKK